MVLCWYQCQKLNKTSVIDTVLGIPVSHIIALHRPNRNIFVIVRLEDIIDVCAYIEFSDSRVNYAAHFPNHLEKD